MKKLPDNELSMQFLGAISLNPWVQHNSSSRMQMTTGHISQSLVINGATPRRCFTGAEAEFGKYTFSRKFPVNATILKVLPKYPKTHGEDQIKPNPQNVIIYEDADSPMKEVGVLVLDDFNSVHQHFGFKYKYNQEAISRLSAGSNIGKGTILADSPSVDEMGNYRYGLEANIVFTSIPGVIEDGIVVSRSFLKRIQAKGYESRVESWGKNYYPINLYGDENTYKPFPDIGDHIREDGLLFALRRYDDLLGPIEMTPAALMEPDYIYDRLVYAEPNAKVTDIVLHHNNSGKYPPTPVGMETQTMKYYRATFRHYQNILSVYYDLKKRRGDKLRITPEFHRLLVEAIGYTHDQTKSKVAKTHRRSPLDDWRVEVHFEYDVIPNIGYKLTGMHGNKGVNCQIWDDEDMPVDTQGNRAEVIMDGDSIIKRMNLGVLYEQYYNAVSRDVSKRVRQMFGLDPFGFELPKGWERQLDSKTVESAWEYLMGYYKIVSPRMYDLMTTGPYKGTHLSHVTEVIKDGVYVYIPTDNPAESVEVVKQLNQHYPPHIGPLTYRGRSGNVVTTEKNIMIGSIYMILLEKTGSDWSGVASSKLQHFGIPAKLTKFDKFSAPGRGQPVRMMGETEVRLTTAAAGGEVVADILDQSNNPATHKEILTNILRADQPTNIQKVIDRRKYPIGNGRNLVFIRHIMECSGNRFIYTPEK